MTQREYKVRPNERLAVCYVYLAALLPLWGILIDWAIRESWRLRSRHVAFNATQAIWLQVGLLLCFVAYAGARIVVNVLAALAPGFATGFALVNNILMASVIALYAVLCLVAAWLGLDGRRVRIPPIGRRIYEQEFGEKPS